MTRPATRPVMSRHLPPWALNGRRDAPPPWYKIGPVVLGNPRADLVDAPPDPLVDPPPADDPPPVVGTSVDVYVYDVIGGWFGLTAEDFVRDVADLDVDEIVLHVNSPGGDAVEGVAIANVLRAHRARIVVRIDGIAASAASVVAMAGDEVVMGVGAQIMLHDAWGYCQGNSAEMAAAQRMLDSTSNALASTYAAHVEGTTAEQWRAIMRAETWYGAEEAVTAGLADRVAAADEVGTASGEHITPGGMGGDLWGWWDSMRDQARFDLSAYTYAGRAAAPTPRMPRRARPAASAAGSNHREGSGPVAFSDEQLDKMRTALGLPDDATEDDIVAAVESSGDTDGDTDGGDEGGGDGDEGGDPLAALPDGIVAIDAEVLAALRAQAARGDAAHQRQQREDREAKVDAAIRDGRIPVARRKAWIDMLAADPGAAAQLAALEPGLIPVDGERGSANSPDAHDDLYARLFPEG